MFQLLIFFYILDCDTKVKIYMSVEPNFKHLIFDGCAAYMPKSFSHDWVINLAIDDSGCLNIVISEEPLANYLKD